MVGVDWSSMLFLGSNAKGLISIVLMQENNTWTKQIHFVHGLDALPMQ